MDELIDMETTGWTALSEGKGADYYQRVMADEGVMLLPGVGRLSKDEAVAGLRHAPPWSWYEVDDVQVVPLNAEAGVVSYSVSAQREGQPVYEALMSSTYVRRDQEWILLVHQQTPTPA